MQWDYEYLFFDFDGTLFDTEDDIVSAVNHVRINNGLEKLPKSLVASYVGQGVNLLLQKSFMDFPQKLDNLENLVEQFKAFYLQNPVVHTKMYKGVRELLPQFKKKVIVSNKTENLVRVILQAFDMEQDFLQIIGGDTFAVKKPEPSLMTEIEKLDGFNNLRDKKVVMVGDGQPDHDFAKSLKLPFICCNYGFSNVSDNYENMIRIDSFVEIKRYLQTD